MHRLYCDHSFAQIKSVSGATATAASSKMNDEGFVFRRRNEWFQVDSIYPSSMARSEENHADVLISNYDYLYSCISNETFDTSLYSNLVLLSKFILENGAQLDDNLNYKEQMDMFFSLFRNLLRNHLKSLPESISLLILRLIEIRASKWKLNSNIEEYYVKKLKRNLSQSDDVGKTNELRISNSFADILAGNVEDSGNNRKNKNKPVIKDEVVIKNSDSGKVMGIKGRRVHMIEEMSDTVISFQKATPNAKERTIQISGTNQENIEKAKSLIDVTIKQNTSPIPFNETIIAPKGGDEAGDDCTYELVMNHNNKEIVINCSDKFIGEKLEQFIKEYHFNQYIESNDSTGVLMHLDGYLNGQNPLTYDRDFLLKLKDHSTGAKISNVIEEIKQNQINLYRD